ncbi:transcription factor MTB1-like [Vicia villosa]|uniref:transcription factor MTB1-like n=1 Tax=Vicia villosa TaxID=3911 RepID=UPI00273BE6F4|nr:transcription factor MTB1-like [Vicia villosa]
MGLTNRMLSWNEQDKSMLQTVLGPPAFYFVITNCLSNENVLIAIGGSAATGADSLQNKLSDLVENSSTFNWNYAIFWQLSQSKSGDYILGWGDGCCRDPHEDEQPETFQRYEEKKVEQNMGNKVLQKPHKTFGGSDEDNYIIKTLTGSTIP